MPDLRRGVSDSCAVKLEQVAIVPGAQAGLYTALMLLLGMEGGQVVVPTPCYSTYEPTILLAGGAPVCVPMPAHDGFRLSVQV